MKTVNYQMKEQAYSRKNYHTSGFKKPAKRLYIVNRPKFIMMSLLTLIILSILINMFTGLFMSEASTQNSNITLKIVKGDTLWEIAKSYNFYDEDIRAVVHRIKKANELEDGQLYAGQTLLIPLDNRND